MSISYYSGVNRELLARIPLTAKRILEVGCGAGDFARAYLARNPSAHYFGVELFMEAADQAADYLSHVITGDIELPETIAALDEVSAREPFDTLIFGDVLEHLRDPWRVLADLRSRTVPGGICVACVPNVCHWSILQQQLKGRWDYADVGLLDRTHLRFFTLETAAEMFQQAGYAVLDANPRIFLEEQTEDAMNSFAGLGGRLGIAPEKLRRDLSAFQWVIRAINGPKPTPLFVAALGLPKFAGATEARVDYPLSALMTMPSVHAIWGDDESLHVPPDWPSGIFILHRSDMRDSGLVAHVETLITQGWIIVADMDDDPNHWQSSIENDYYEYKCVHGVTVSTEQLAETIRPWNVNVKVFSNAIYELPQSSLTTPKQGDRLRVFFGALNREPEWAVLLPVLEAAAKVLSAGIELVVVHDRAFFDALAENITKEFYPTLPHDRYMEVLASCDVALLPLNDTRFNRHKSDLKFIECCAAGVVPICSTVVYGERSVHREIGIFADMPEDWYRALVTLCSDTPEIQRRRALGLSYVLRERMHSHHVVARETYYRMLLRNRADLEVQRRSRLAKISARQSFVTPGDIAKLGTKTFLHVGCGPSHKDQTTRAFNTPEWHELRLDINEAVNPDIVGTMLDMSAVADESVDALFSAHNIEYLYAHEVPLALAEFRRVLKPDGFMVSTCPDLQSVCQLIAEDKLTEPAYESSAGPITPLDILYGHRSAMQRGNLFMAPRCGFTEKVLVATVQDAGFCAVVSGSRAHPCYDLWVVASKEAKSEAEMAALAESHFPE